MIDPLEHRIRELRIRTPPALVPAAIAAAARPSTIAGRGFGSSARPRAARRRVALGAGLIAALLAANAVGTYFVPRYGQALANAPFLGAASGPILRSVGLDGSSLTELSGSTTSNGHTLQLVSGYADSVRTVVFVQVDGRPLEAPSKTSYGFYLHGTLSDQFGHTYHQVFGGAQGAASSFEPMVWPATATGARLTLHVTALMPTGYGDSTVKGDWSLTFTLTQQPGRLLDLPAPLQVGDTTYTFTRMQVSGDLFELNWSITGGAATRMDALVDGYYGRNPAPPPAVQEKIREAGAQLVPTLLGPNGTSANFLEWGWELPRRQPARGNLKATIPVHGRWVIRLGPPGQTAERAVDI
jgi:hypothetical protein